MARLTERIPQLRLTGGQDWNQSDGVTNLHRTQK